MVTTQVSNVLPVLIIGLILYFVLNNKIVETLSFAQIPTRTVDVKKIPLVNSVVKSTNKVRYVRVQFLDDKPHQLNINEIQCYNDQGVNVALGAKVTVGKQMKSITNFGGQYALDGILTTARNGRWKLAHQKECYGAFIEVDLGEEKSVGTIVIINRNDCCLDGIVGATVMALDQNRNVVEKKVLSDAKASYEISVGKQDPATIQTTKTVASETAATKGIDGKMPAGGFVDPLAKWIWVPKSSVVNHEMPGFSVLKMNQQYFNATTKNMPVILCVSFVKEGQVLLNDKQVPIPAHSTPILQVPMTLIPGNNLIELRSRNDAGPTGAIASMFRVDTKQVVLRTDNSWTWDT